MARKRVPMFLLDESPAPAKRKAPPAPPPEARKEPQKPPPKPAGKAPPRPVAARKAAPPPPSPPTKPQAKAPAKNGSTFVAADVDKNERAEVLAQVKQPRSGMIPIPATAKQTTETIGMLEAPLSEVPVARGQRGPVPPVPEFKPKPPPAGTVPVVFKGGRMEITYKCRVRLYHNQREGTVVIEEYVQNYPELEDPK